MEIIVYPSVQEIFNVTKAPEKTFVKRPDGTFWRIAEYVKLPSFDIIGETICDINASGGEVFIIMEKR